MCSASARSIAPGADNGDAGAATRTSPQHGPGRMYECSSSWRCDASLAMASDLDTAFGLDAAFGLATAFGLDFDFGAMSNTMR